MLWHRGLTHSLAGLLIFPPALAVLAHALAPRISLARALILSEVGVISHLLLDVPTAWGTMVLYPWSRHRFALDWVFIIDVVLWVVLAAGGLLGIRRAARTRRLIAAAALAAAALYVATAGILHERAEDLVRGRVADPSLLEPPYGFEVYPAPFSPLGWHAVVWQGDSLVHLFLRGIRPRVERTEREPHGLGEPDVHAALVTEAGQAFLWWARAPAGRVIRRGAESGAGAGVRDDARTVGAGVAAGRLKGGGTVVAFGDRRFYVRGRDVFAFEVTLDGDGEYVGATWEGEPVFER